MDINKKFIIKNVFLILFILLFNLLNFYYLINSNLKIFEKQVEKNVESYSKSQITYLNSKKTILSILSKDIMGNTANRILTNYYSKLNLQEKNSLKNNLILDENLVLYKTYHDRYMDYINDIYMGKEDSKIFLTDNKFNILMPYDKIPLNKTLFNKNLFQLSLSKENIFLSDFFYHNDEVYFYIAMKSFELKSGKITDKHMGYFILESKFNTFNSPFVSFKNKNDLIVNGLFLKNYNDNSVSIINDEKKFYAIKSLDFLNKKFFIVYEDTNNKYFNLFYMTSITITILFFISLLVIYNIISNSRKKLFQNIDLLSNELNKTKFLDDRNYDVSFKKIIDYINKLKKEKINIYNCIPKNESNDVFFFNEDSLFKMLIDNFSKNFSFLNTVISYKKHKNYFEFQKFFGNERSFIYKFKKIKFDIEDIQKKNISLYKVYNIKEIVDDENLDINTDKNIFDIYFVMIEFNFEYKIFLFPIKSSNKNIEDSILLFISLFKNNIYFYSYLNEINNKKQYNYFNIYNELDFYSMFDILNKKSNLNIMIKFKKSNYNSYEKYFEFNLKILNILKYSFKDIFFKYSLFRLNSEIYLLSIYDIDNKQVDFIKNILYKNFYDILLNDEIEIQVLSNINELKTKILKLT
jgi:hypothetical protein